MASPPLANYIAAGYFDDGGTGIQRRSDGISRVPSRWNVTPRPARLRRDDTPESCARKFRLGLRLPRERNLGKPALVERVIVGNRPKLPRAKPNRQALPGMEAVV